MRSARNVASVGPSRVSAYHGSSEAHHGCGLEAEEEAAAPGALVGEGHCHGLGARGAVRGVASAFVVWPVLRESR